MCGINFQSLGQCKNLVALTLHNVNEVSMKDFVRFFTFQCREIFLLLLEK
jgi:hypothetical protein